jgi:hypothetical protein
MVGCIGGDNDTSLDSCQPGVTETCYCPSGDTGSRTCADDGASFGPCVCGEAAADTGTAEVGETDVGSDTDVTTETAGTVPLDGGEASDAAAADAGAPTETDTGFLVDTATGDTSDTEATDTGELTCFHTETCGEPVPYERQICGFPLTPTVDGNLDEWVWQSADWAGVDYTMGPSAADSDADASFELACVADLDFVYFAFRITDDVIVTGESSGCDLFGDDAIEIFIDGCYEPAGTYDGDEAMITIGADSIGITDPGSVVLGGCSGPFSGADTGSIVHTIATEAGWKGEVAVPLRPAGDLGWDLTPAEGQVIGFNAAYNDDDDGGDRDHKLIWALNDRLEDRSWTDPRQFGELQFCPVESASR